MDVFPEGCYDYPGEGCWGVLQTERHDIVSIGIPLRCESCRLFLFGDSRRMVS